MSRQRHSARSVLLSDDTSRLLLRAHFADSRRVVPTADDDACTAPAAALPRRRRKALATAFPCPCCKRADGVECVIDLKRKVGEASCWACGASYAAPAHALTEPVDVYSEWTDDERRRRAGSGVDRDGDVVMSES